MGIRAGGSLVPRTGDNDRVIDSVDPDAPDDRRRRRRAIVCRVRREHVEHVEHVELVELVGQYVRVRDVGELPDQEVPHEHEQHGPERDALHRR